MHRLITVLGLCCFALRACGSAPSVHPLSDPKEAKPDERLTGVWGEKDEEGEPEIYFHFVPREDGFTDVVQIGQFLDDDDGAEISVYRVFPTTIAKRNYLSARSLSYNEEEDEWEAQPAQPYILVRYEISEDNVLSLWHLGIEETAEVIKAGKLKGKFKETTSKSGKRISAKLTAETEELRAYLREAGPDDLFIDYGKYLRLVPASPKKAREEGAE